MVSTTVRVQPTRRTERGWMTEGRVPVLEVEVVAVVDDVP